MKKITPLTVISALLLTFMVSIVPASAQHPPLVFLMNGDLWKWSPGDAQPTQMTQWGYNFRPVISPDGTRVAYKSWAELSVNAINDAGLFPGDMPANIWVMNVATLEAQRVADQPAGVTVENGAIIRSDPAWSPDGNALAWIEMVNANDFVFRLVTYDFVTGISKVMVPSLPLPFMDGGVYVPPVQWGSGGISYNIGSFDQNQNNFAQTVYVYQPDGSLTSATQVADFDSSYVMEDFWFGGSIGLVYSSGQTAVLNPVNGSIAPADGNPVLQADGGVSANALLMSVQPGNGAYNVNWFVIDNFVNNLAQLPYFGITSYGGLAPGPDGMSFAYITDALYVWTQGQVIQVPGTQGLNDGFPGAAVVWAAEYWYIQSDAPIPEPVPGACSGNVPARLLVGQRGRVIPGLGANVIRMEPNKGANSAVIGNIPERGEFDVLQGPTCGDGINWWLVSYSGVVGWTGEGEGQTYWVEPVTTDSAACTLTPRLKINGTGVVLPGLPNVLRTQPFTGSASAIIGRIPSGGTFTVLDGPRCGNGYYWWLVDYNGTVGWTAEGEGSTYWLEPH
ncbi:MAG: SH3 domain-containing protein [Anaerolineae bacterium]|nr:SH3 domain-containing protein [Anaerolineae bacterium]